MRGPTNPTGYLFPTRRAGKLVGFEGKGRKRTGGYFIAFEGHMQKDAMLILFQQLLGKTVDGKLVKATDPANGKPFDLHGLRTTFATWVADNRATVYDMDAQKIALDLAPGDHMTRIYDRADLLDQRRDLAERWARFLTQTVSNQ
jgi:integrase